MSRNCLAWQVGAALLTALCSMSLATAQPVVPEDEQVKVARSIAVELGGKLKSELSTALAAGGPVQALAVCKTAAPTIAAELAAASGGKVGRTALRVRNPSNAADAFERAVLMRFVEDAANGADAAALEHSEVVQSEGRRTMRYMKAIPMQAAPCAACHGSEVSPEVLQAVRTLSADEAVGFKPGDIRGAFTIELPLP